MVDRPVGAVATRGGAPIRFMLEKTNKTRSWGREVED